MAMYLEMKATFVPETDVESVLATSMSKQRGFTKFSMFLKLVSLLNPGVRTNFVTFPLERTRKSLEVRFGFGPKPGFSKQLFGSSREGTKMDWTSFKQFLIWWSNGTQTVFMYIWFLFSEARNEHKHPLHKLFDPSLVVSGQFVSLRFDEGNEVFDLTPFAGRRPPLRMVSSP